MVEHYTILQKYINFIQKLSEASASLDFSSDCLLTNAYSSSQCGHGGDAVLACAIYQWLLGAAFRRLRCKWNCQVNLMSNLCSISSTLQLMKNCAEFSMEMSQLCCLHHYNTPPQQYSSFVHHLLPYLNVLFPNVWGAEDAEAVEQHVRSQYP